MNKLLITIPLVLAVLVTAKPQLPPPKDLLPKGILPHEITKGILPPGLGKCALVICDHFSTCVIDDNDKPKCVCNMDCTGDPELFFCDVEGNEYRTMCHVNKEMCKQQKEFFYVPGKCQGCKNSEGGLYKHGEIVRAGTEETPCQEEVCSNGAFVTRLNQECLSKLGFECSTGPFADEALKCEEGYSCMITRKSDDLTSYPNLGKCQKKGKEVCYHQGKKFKVGEEFISEDCSSKCSCDGWDKINCVSLCPPTVIQCKSDEIEEQQSFPIKDSHCTCKRPVCEKAAITCAKPKESGPCFAYIKSFFFNKSTKKCDNFIYGGCGGNGNRFQTKKECEKKCIPTTPSAGELKIKKVADEWSWPVPKPRKPILSDIEMTLKGRIDFKGVKKVLPSPSCLYVTLADVSLMDAPSTVIGTQRFNVSNFDTSNMFQYEMAFKKPAESQLLRRYSVSARIHLGRCPEKLQVIKRGEFITDTHFGVSLSRDKDSYDKDFKIICYACEEEEKKEEPQGPPQPTEIDTNESKVVLLGKGCTFEGKRYSVRERFANKGCKGECVCLGNDRVSCTPLCPITDTKCESGSIAMEVAKPHAKYPQCQCQMTECMRNLTVTENEPELPGDEPRGPDGGPFTGEYTPGVAYNVTLEKNKTITISGNIRFKEHQTILKDMCLQIILQDASIADADGFVVKESRFDFMNHFLNSTTLNYTIVAPKPIEKDLHGQYDVSVALLHGECSDDSLRLRAGDYYSDHLNHVRLTTDENEYVVNIDVTKIKGSDDDNDEEEEEEEFGGFEEYGGAAPNVSLELNRTITLTGEIEFKKELGVLPNGSCIKLRLEDISIADGSLFLVGERKFDLSGVEIKTTYQYKFTVPKPIEDDLHEFFAISAVLNKGWCSEGMGFEEGDLYTDTNFMVSLTNETDRYDDNEMFLKEHVKAEEEEEVGPEVPGDDDDVKEGTTELAPAPLDDLSACVNPFTNETYKDGDNWMEGKCAHCSCDQGKRFCALESCKIDCDPKYLVQKEDRCCPICVPPPPKDCIDETTNTTRPHKSNWKPDACSSCTCEHGETICATQDCAPVMCKDPVTPEGECCPRCVTQECWDRESKSYYKEMDKWTMSDGCTSCFCFMGSPMCMSPGCALEECDEGVKHVKVKGICCPVCENKLICEVEDGRKFVEGNRWQDDDCKVCKCTKDGIQCNNPIYEKDQCDSNFVQLNQKCPKVCLNASKLRKEEKQQEGENEKEEEEEAEVNPIYP
ncbi:uncharacterized protein [Clytia hemisphaerica]|uniref:uncharacterized protein isoform X3 n=1 Tax=Clytia hemisphaerica TaxID=252671 RepID=UPI0034D5F665